MAALALIAGLVVARWPRAPRTTAALESGAEVEVQALPAGADTPLGLAEPAVPREPLRAVQVEAPDEPAAIAWPLELRGRVVDEQRGLALSGARVRARLGEHAAEALTGADGAFALTGLEGDALPRTVWLRVDAPRHASWLGEVEAAPRAAPAVVDCGELPLRAGTRVRGRVVDGATGEPRAGVPLFLADLAEVHASGGHVTSDARFVLRAGRSDERGGFELQRVARSSPTLHLIAHADDALGMAPLAVVEGLEELDDVVVELAPCAALEVEVARADGTPATDARVTLVPRGALAFPRIWHEGHLLDDEPWAPGWTRREVDVDGRARFAGLPAPGADAWYDLVASDDLERIGALEALRPTPGEQLEARVVLAERELLARLAGRVVDAGGHPLEGALVAVGEEETRTDALGAFAFTDLAARRGSWSVRATARGYASAGRHLTADGVADGGIEGLELVLEPLAPVAGVARDTRGAPMSYAPLVLTREAPRESWACATDENGVFRFAECTGGPLVLRAGGLRPALDLARDCELEVRGGDEGVDFVCERLPAPTGRLDARILDAATGAALAPLAALLMVPHERASGDRLPPVPRRPLRSLGRVRAEELHPGRYLLGVAVEGGCWGVAAFDIAAPGDEAVLELSLGACAIEGRVDPSDGAAGALVVATLERFSARPLLGSGAQLDEDAVLRARVAADGSFRFEPTIPGPYVVELPGERGAARAQVTARAGETARVVLRPVASATLHLTSRAPWTGGHLVVRVELEDGREDLWRVAAPDGALLDLRLDYPPGELRWTISSTSPDAPGPGRWIGGAQVPAGHTRALRLDE